MKIKFICLRNIKFFYISNHIYIFKTDLSTKHEHNIFRNYINYTHLVNIVSVRDKRKKRGESTCPHYVKKIFYCLKLNIFIVNV